MIGLFYILRHRNLHCKHAFTRVLRTPEVPPLSPSDHEKRFAKRLCKRFLQKMEEKYNFLLDR